MKDEMPNTDEALRWAAALIATPLPFGSSPFLPPPVRAQLQPIRYVDFFRGRPSEPAARRN